MCQTPGNSSTVSNNVPDSLEGGANAHTRCVKTSRLPLEIKYSCIVSLLSVGVDIEVLPYDI